MTMNLDFFGENCEITAPESVLANLARALMDSSSSNKESGYKAIADIDYKLGMQIYESLKDNGYFNY